MKKRIIALLVSIFVIGCLSLFNASALSLEDKPYFYDVQIDKEGEILGDGDTITVTCKLANSDVVPDSCTCMINLYSSNVYFPLYYNDETESYEGSYTFGETYDNPIRASYIMYISTDVAGTYCNEAAHPFGEIEFYYCNKCKDGTHFPETKNGTFPTCKDEGLTEGTYCSLCNTVITEQTIIPATGHKEEVIPSKPATCTESGLTDGKKCTTCGEITVPQTVIPATGHIEETIKGKEATCTKAGLTDGKKCTTCGEVTVKQTVIPALGHTETTLKAVKPTYTKTGLTEGKKCSVCGKVTVKQKKVAKKKLKKVTISSVKSTKKKTALVSWKKVTDASGYIVEYSTSKKFTKKTTKKVTIKKGKTTKTTLKKLKSGKKYYVRIRAYKTVNKKTVYGAYSSVKSVKIK